MDYSKIENQRQSNKKLFTTLFFIGLPLLIVGIILSIIAFNDYNFPQIGIFIGIPGFVLLILSLSIPQSKFNKYIDREIKPILLKDIYGNYESRPSGGFSYQRLASYGMFKKPDEYHSNNYFKATHSEVEFESADVDFVYITYTTDSQGHTQRHEDHNRATVIIFELERNLNMALSIVEKTTTGRISTRKLCSNKIEFESIDFNKKFVSTTDDDHGAFYLVTPQFQIHMMDCEKSFRGQFAFYLIGRKVIIVMANNSVKYTHSIFKEFNDGAIDSLRKSLSYPATFIDLLRLDSEKLNNTSL